MRGRIWRNVGLMLLGIVLTGITGPLSLYVTGFKTGWAWHRAHGVLEPYTVHDYLLMAVPGLFLGVLAGFIMIFIVSFAKR